MANPIEIVKVFNLLRIAYPHIERDKTPEQLELMAELWVSSLSDMDIEQLQIAARQLIAESRFFPAISELRDRVLSFRQLAEDVPDWTEAWQDVQRAISRYGFEEGARLGLKIFSDPHIEMAVRRVGWRDICMCDEDQVNTLRAQFRDTYNILVKREEQEAKLLPESRREIIKLTAKLDINAPRLHKGKAA